MTYPQNEPNLQKLDIINQLIRQDPGQRGFSSISPIGELEMTAKSLLENDRILIVTGFCVLAAMTGETDGPPGALVLASALKQLNKQVMLVTDQYSAFLLTAGMKYYSEKTEVVVISDNQAQADLEMNRLLDQFQPGHIIAIERPGRAADGQTYSMRGEKLNDVIPQLDLLFEKSLTRNIYTSAIGDGGNELGMGNVYELIKKHVHLGEKIGCVTPADLLISAGVSNWAGYGLAAALSLMTDANLLPSVETEENVLKSMVRSGAVDGCTKKREVTVDGLSWEAYIDVIHEIIKTVIA